MKSKFLNLSLSFVAALLVFNVALAQSGVGFGPGQTAKKTKLDLAGVTTSLTGFNAAQACSYVDEVNHEVDIFSNVDCPAESNGKVKGIVSVPDFRNRTLVFAADTKEEFSEILGSEFFVKQLPRASTAGILSVRYRQNFGQKREVAIGEYMTAGSGAKFTALCSGTYSSACQLQVDDKGNLAVRMAARDIKDLMPDNAFGK